MFELVVTATGEVRDKDGNLIESVPVEMKRVVSEDELKAIYEAHQAATEGDTP